MHGSLYQINLTHQSQCATDYNLVKLCYLFINSKAQCIVLAHTSQPLVITSSERYVPLNTKCRKFCYRALRLHVKEHLKDINTLHNQYLPVVCAKR